MSGQYNPQAYNPPPGPGGPPAQPKKSFKKGLGFFPSSISRAGSDPVTTMIREAPTIAKGQCALSSPENYLIGAGANIPLFNLETIAEATGDERQRLVQAFGSALAHVGFIGIKADNLGPLVQGLYGDMEKYFHKPFEQKLADWNRGEGKQGFSYRGCEIAPKAERPDYKESFFIPPHFSRWPQTGGSFSRTASEFHATMTLYAQFLYSILVEYLDQPVQDAEKLISEGYNLLRLAYFPAIKPGDDPKGIWASPHRDRNVLSIMTPGTIPGLQYYSPKGLWQPVIVPENYLIVTTGLLLQHKTAGLMKASWHCVVNPGGKFTRLERFSSVFYATWPEEYSLEPFKNCADAATKGMPPRKKRLHLRRYPDITVGQKETQNFV